MSKISDAAKRCSGFLTEVQTEMKKSVWPSRPELVESTLVVIITVLLLGAFVYVCDFVLVKVITFLTGLRGGG